MPIVNISDNNGNTIKLLSCIGGFWTPSFSEEALINMKDFPLREDDVVFSSYPKSGCHWVCEILRLLIAGKISLEDQAMEKKEYMMEWRPYKHYDSLPAPRVLNNHMPFHLMPKALLVKKPKVVFYYRNLKDVAVSYYHHHKGIHSYEYNGDFNSYLQMMVTDKFDTGNPFKYIQSWEKGIAENADLPVFVGSYEDMKENNLSEVKRLSQFLGKDYSDDFLQQVCAITSFDKMREIKGEKAFKNKDGDPAIYRKGQVGDWKNHFTVAQNEWFDGIIKRETVGSKFNFRYTL